MHLNDVWKLKLVSKTKMVQGTGYSNKEDLYYQEACLPSGNVENMVSNK